MALDKVKQGVIADDAVGSPQITGDAVGTSEIADNITIAGTSHLGIPAGTTDQRPGSASAGNTRFNTTVGSLEFYDGTSWVSTNEPTPTITSISGTIFAGISGRSLTITGLNFNTTNISVEWLDGTSRIEIEANVTPTSATSVTRTIPASVYGKASGTTIGIRVLNAGVASSNIDTSKSVTAVPSGGTTSTSGNYYIHTFTASDATGFTNTISNLSVEYLVIGGGGSGGNGNDSGGGGAGGFRTNVSGATSGRNSSAESAMTLSVTNYPVTVGGGGSRGGQTNGSDSSFNGITSLGGGRGGYGTSGASNLAGASGGCGGGGDNDGPAAGGSGTSGQGYDGAAGNNTDGGGGGGAGANGSNSEGGDGIQSSITGTATYYAGGGGGGGETNTSFVGGQGGGGDGTTGTSGTNGSPNTGGGGGSVNDTGTGGGGGSGIVIIRYQLPA